MVVPEALVSRAASALRELEQGGGWPKRPDITIRAAVIVAKERGITEEALMRRARIYNRLNKEN